MCTVQDVTELVRMEQERDALQTGLRQAQKMEGEGGVCKRAAGPIWDVSDANSTHLS